MASPHAGECGRYRNRPWPGTRHRGRDRGRGERRSKPRLRQRPHDRRIVIAAGEALPLYRRAGDGDPGPTDTGSKPCEPPIPAPAPAPSNRPQRLHRPCRRLRTVTDPEALAQMQCLADGNGGTFTTTPSNADRTDPRPAHRHRRPPRRTPEPEPVAPGSDPSVAVTGTEDGPPGRDGPVCGRCRGNDGAVFTDRDGNPLEDSVRRRRLYPARLNELNTEPRPASPIAPSGTGPA